MNRRILDIIGYALERLCGIANEEREKNQKPSRCERHLSIEAGPKFLYHKCFYFSSVGLAPD